MISDELLKQASKEYMDAVFRSLPEPEACTCDFSPAFEKKMKRLLRKAAHPIAHRILRTAASFLLVLLLGISSFLAVNVEARQAVFGWIREQYDTYIRYVFVGAEIPAAPENYCPGWFPRDYTFKTELNVVNGKIFIFTNSKGDVGQFSYCTAMEGGSLQWEVEGFDHKKVRIGSLAGDLYTDPQGMAASELIWLDKKAQVLFSISALAPEEELLRAAESIQTE